MSNNPEILTFAAPQQQQQLVSFAAPIMRQQQPQQPVFGFAQAQAQPSLPTPQRAWQEPRRSKNVVDISFTVVSGALTVGNHGVVCNPAKRRVYQPVLNGRWYLGPNLGFGRAVYHESLTYNQLINIMEGIQHHFVAFWQPTPDILEVWGDFNWSIEDKDDTFLAILDAAQQPCESIDWSSQKDVQLYPHGVRLDIYSEQLTDVWIASTYVIIFERDAYYGNYGISRGLPGLERNLPVEVVLKTPTTTTACDDTSRRLLLLEDHEKKNTLTAYTECKTNVQADDVYSLVGGFDNISQSGMKAFYPPLSIFRGEIHLAPQLPATSLSPTQEVKKPSVASVVAFQELPMRQQAENAVKQVDTTREQNDLANKTLSITENLPGRHFVYWEQLGPRGKKVYELTRVDKTRSPTIVEVARITAPTQDLAFEKAFTQGYQPSSDAATQNYYNRLQAATTAQQLLSIVI